MDEQTSIEKKYDFGFGNNIKDSNEFAFKLTGIIKMKFKDLSKANAIKNAKTVGNEALRLIAVERQSSNRTMNLVPALPLKTLPTQKTLNLPS